MKEQLSALIDGEFDIDDAEHLLMGAKSDGELKQSWNDYHLIGDMMRGNDMHHDQFTQRVMDIIDDEPTILAPAVSKTNSQQQPVKKTPSWMSVAASVAAVMFVALVLLQNQTATTDTLAPIEIAESIPTEYLAAHQAYAPNGTATYIQTVAYTGQ